MFEGVKEIVGYVIKKMIADVFALPETVARFEGLLFSPAVFVLAFALVVFTVRYEKATPRPAVLRPFFGVFAAAYKKRKASKPDFVAELVNEK